MYIFDLMVVNEDRSEAFQFICKAESISTALDKATVVVNEYTEGNEAILLQKINSIEVIE